MPHARPLHRRALPRAVAALAVAVGLVAACSSGGSTGGSTTGTTGAAGGPGASAGAATGHDHGGSGAVYPGSGSPVGPSTPSAVDVYAHTRAGMISPAIARDPALVYVPNLGSGTVSVIDQRTLQVVRTIPVGREPQHVVPSWDLKTLWVNNNAGNTLTPIDPATGQRRGPDVPVEDPYNLYFTPNGQYAMVMAEALTRIDFYDPQTFRLQKQLTLGPACQGVNHADFSPDGSYFIATCEFAGRLVKVSLVGRPHVVGYLDLNEPGKPSAPQDIKIDPAGQVWYVADMNRNGLHEVDGNAFRRIGFLPTGPETHGLYPSRDGRYLYVANRGGRLVQQVEPFAHQGDDGSVSVVDFRTRRVVATWTIPGGGTPDMGNVSADGSRLWLSGRRSNVVYVFDTRAGRLLTEIPVGSEPHGLAVWPLPGRHSLGHTGILR